MNVCTWSRGHQADWDYYAKETGDPRWNYENVLLTCTPETGPESDRISRQGGRDEKGTIQ